MATLVYNSYYNNYNNGDFDINNVDFRVRLVADTYTPAANHLPINTLTHTIMFIPSAVVGNIIATKSMGEIIEAVKTRIIERVEELRDNMSEIFDAIDNRISDPDRRERIKNLFMRLLERAEERARIWDELKEQGVKYFVVENTTLNRLCWCEDIF